MIYIMVVDTNTNLYAELYDFFLFSYLTEFNKKTPDFMFPRYSYYELSILGVYF